jgi:hypothetical protein
MTLAAGASLERLHRLLVHLAGGLQAVGLLEPVDGLLGVLAPPAIDDAGGEAVHVQEDLDPGDGGPRHVPVDREPARRALTVCALISSQPRGSGAGRRRLRVDSPVPLARLRCPGPRPTVSLGVLSPAGVEATGLELLGRERFRPGPLARALAAGPTRRSAAGCGLYAGVVVIAARAAVRMVRVVARHSRPNRVMVPRGQGITVPTGGAMAMPRGRSALPRFTCST